MYLIETTDGFYDKAGSDWELRDKLTEILLDGIVAPEDITIYDITKIEVEITPTVTLKFKKEQRYTG